MWMGYQVLFQTLCTCMFLITQSFMIFWLLIWILLFCSRTRIVFWTGVSSSWCKIIWIMIANCVCMYIATNFIDLLLHTYVAKDWHQNTIKVQCVTDIHINSTSELWTVKLDLLHTRCPIYSAGSKVYSLRIYILGLKHNI